LIGVNRVLEQDVEQGLVPVHVGVVRDFRAGGVRQRLVIAGEGLVGFKRHACFHDARFGQARAVLVNVNGVGEPKGGGLRQQMASLRQIQIARAAGGKVDVAHGL
jgi:hypothetical protein